MDFRLHYFILILSLFPSFVFTQNTDEQYFSANFPKESGWIGRHLKTADILFFEATAPHRTHKASTYVAAMNKEGTILWNSFQWEDHPDFGFILEDWIVGSNQMIYISTSDALRCVHQQTGQIIWVKWFGPGQVPRLLTERVPGELTYLLQDNNSWKNPIVTVDATNGNTLRTGLIAGINPRFLLGGPDDVLYYGFKDSVAKVDALQPDQTFWRIKAAQNNMDGNTYDRAFLNAGGTSLMLFGEENYFPLQVRINTSTGSVVNYTKLQTGSSFTLMDVVRENDRIYACWLHSFTGAWNMLMTATHEPTGTLLYNTNYAINDPSTNMPFNGSHGLFSIASDNQGSLFLTGYTNAAEYPPGAWAVLKVNASNGEIITEKVLDITSGGADVYSVGNIIWYTADQRLWSLGAMQTSDRSSTPKAVEVAPDNFSIIQEKSLTGNFQYHSAATKMVTTPDGIATLKSFDNIIRLDKTDLAQNALWTSDIASIYDHQLQPIGLYRGKDNFWWITALSTSAWVNNPAVITPDSTHLFKINDAGGQIEGHWAFEGISGAPMFPMHVNAKSDTVILVCHRGDDDVVIRLINGQPQTSVLSQQLQFLDAAFDNIQAPNYLFSDQDKNTVFRITGSTYYLIKPTSEILLDNLTVPISAKTTVAIPGQLDVLSGGDFTNNSGWGIFRHPSSTSNIVWSTTGFTGNIQRIVVNRTGTSAYTYGIINQHLFFKRFNINTGALIWEKTIQYPSAQIQIREMVLDEINQRLIVVGQLGVNGGWNIWVLGMDLDGNVTGEVFRLGDKNLKANEALCATVTPSGEVYVGGRTYRFGLGKAGFVWHLPGTFYTVSGKVYLDTNNNSLYDNNDQPWNNVVHIQPGNYLVFPDSLGKYRANVTAEGTYTAAVPSPSPHISTVNATFDVGNTQTSVNNADVRLYPLNWVHDLSVRLEEATELRYGFPVVMSIAVENPGTLPLDSFMMNIDCGPHLDWQGMVPVQPADTAINLSWNNGMFSATFGGSNPLQKRFLGVQGQLNTFLPIGDTLVCTIQALTYPNDAVTSNNTDTLRLVVTGSFDPNDLTAYPSGATPLASLDNNGALDMEYRIRFENTGNSPTRFIRVEFEYSPLLRPETFRLGASSALCNARFIENNRLELLFDDYQLPSTSEDSMAAQGYVFFKMRSQNDLKTGDGIAGQAKIYFDYNPPIITNSTWTYLVPFVGTDEPSQAKPAWTIAPNPVAPYRPFSILHQQSSNPYWFMYDLKGNLVSQGRGLTDIEAPNTGAYWLYYEGHAQLLMVK